MSQPLALSLDLSLDDEDDSPPHDSRTAEIGTADIRVVETAQARAPVANTSAPELRGADALTMDIGTADIRVVEAVTVAFGKAEARSRGGATAAPVGSVATEAITADVGTADAITAKVGTAETITTQSGRAASIAQPESSSSDELTVLKAEVAASSPPNGVQSTRPSRPVEADQNGATNAPSRAVGSVRTPPPPIVSSRPTVDRPPPPPSSMDRSSRDAALARLRARRQGA